MCTFSARFAYCVIYSRWYSPPIRSRILSADRGLGITCDRISRTEPERLLICILGFDGTHIICRRGARSHDDCVRSIPIWWYFLNKERRAFRIGDLHDVGSSYCNRMPVFRKMSGVTCRQSVLYKDTKATNLSVAAFTNSTFLSRASNKA